MYTESLQFFSFKLQEIDFLAIKYLVVILLQ